MRDLYSAARSLATACYTKGVLAIQTAAAATCKTTNALVYSIAGIMYTKTALATQALTAPSGTVYYTQPANTTAYLVVTLDAAGTVVTYQGDYAGRVVNSAPNVGMVNAQQVGVVGGGYLPDLPDTVCPIGIIKVATGATTFLPGTDALDKASVTFTFFDLAQYPTTQP
jgi:hypothetical protein